MRRPPMPKTNQLDRVYLEFNPATNEFVTAIHGNFAGVALAIARAMRVNEDFAKAVNLANAIRGMP